MEDNSLIFDFWRDDLDNRDVIVSVRCLVFNHEKFIRNALDGFIMQQTSFRYEVIIHDDASTDGTQDIIKEYAIKYPSIIKPILETENQFSKKDGSLGRIMDTHMRGKYVAICEGDDYWTDPLKLQKQVDFLESHPEYSMCFHNAIEHFEDSQIPDRCFSNLENRDYSKIEIYYHWIVPTASVLVRHEVFLSSIYKKAKEDKRFIFGDIIIFLCAAHTGKLKAMNYSMSVYRRHEGSATKVLSPLNLNFIEHHKAIVEVFGSDFKRFAHKIMSFRYMIIHKIYYSQGRKFKAFKYLVKSIRYDLTPLKEIIRCKLSKMVKHILRCDQ